MDATSAADVSMSVLVVYVHGLWLNGWEAAWLRQRLSRELDCETRLFPYFSMTADLKANARALAGFLAQTRTDTLHLVGHSMGGPLILEFFERRVSADGLLASGRPLPPGRIVLLGSPVRGSRAAQRLARLPYGRKLLGSTANELLLEPRERHWSGARDLGVIAGDMAFGLGRLVGPFDAPNDGTVLVEETELPGAKAQLTLHVTHSSLLFSAAVARQTAAFLREGRFAPVTTP
ncbi:MAG: esterase/lipase family protein [Steroidobacteraceae bacterium]